MDSKLDEIRDVVLAEISNSETYDYTQTEDALKYYLGASRADDVEGLSNVQSLDVADMVEAITAQIMPMFNVDKLAEFTANNVDEEQQAREETVAVNYILNEQNNSFLSIQSALKSALLSRNGIFKVYVNETVTIEHIAPIDELSEEQIYAIKSNLNPQQDITAVDVDGVATAAIATTNKKIHVEAIPPEEFRRTRNWNSPDITECPFTSHSREVYRYELAEMGYDPDVASKIPASTAYLSSRTIRQEQDLFTASEDTDLIEFHEAYIKYDHDDDGFSSLLKVIIAGTELLHLEEVNHHVFASGVSVLLPFRYEGVSTFDQQKQVQDTKTKVLRQYVDNMHLNNDRGLEVEYKNILDPNDLTVAVPGRIIRSRRIGSVAPIPVDDIGPSCQNLLSYMDQVRTNRSGSSLDMATQNLQIDNETAHGAERIISSKEMVAANVAATFAQTAIRSVVLLIRQTLKENFETLAVQMDGVFKYVKPTNWQKDTKVSVNIGLSQGERNQKLAALGAILEQQARAFEKGLGDILVTHKNVYNTLTDFVRYSNLKSPEKYWQNPDSKQAQATIQANMQSQQVQAQQQNKMLELQAAKIQSDIDVAKAKEMLAEAKAALDAMRANTDEAVKLDEQAFKHKEHLDNLAMQIAQLEAQYSKQINDYGENLNEIRQSTNI